MAEGGRVGCRSDADHSLIYLWNGRQLLDIQSVALKQPLPSAAGRRGPHATAQQREVRHGLTLRVRGTWQINGDRESDSQ